MIAANTSSGWRHTPGFIIIRGASPLGLPDTRSRAPLRRRAPFAWLTRCRSLAAPRRTTRSARPVDERDRCAGWPWLYTRDAAREHTGPDRPPAASRFVRQARAAPDPDQRHDAGTNPALGGGTEAPRPARSAIGRRKRPYVSSTRRSPDSNAAFTA